MAKFDDNITSRKRNPVDVVEAFVVSNNRFFLEIQDYFDIFKLNFFFLKKLEIFCAAVGSFTEDIFLNSNRNYKRIFI